MNGVNQRKKRMKKNKRFVKKVEWDFGDYWILFFSLNGTCIALSYIFLLQNFDFHHIPILISLFITMFVIPFFDIKRKVYYEEE